MEKSVFLSVRMERDKKSKAMAAANDRGEVLSDVVRDFIDSYIEDAPAIRKPKIIDDALALDASPSPSTEPELTAAVAKPPVRGGRPSDSLLKALGEKPEPAKPVTDDAYWGE